MQRTKMVKQLYNSIKRPGLARGRHRPLVDDRLEPEPQCLLMLSLAALEV